MDRIVNSTEYGICLWSMDTLKVFLKSEKIRAKKLLALFQKDDEKYLKLQKMESGSPFHRLIMEIIV